MPIPVSVYPTGLVLWIVINNEEFESSSHKSREGAEVDESNLKKALLPFEIDLRVWKNYKRQDILNSLKQLRKKLTMILKSIPDSLSLECHMVRNMAVEITLLQVTVSHYSLKQLWLYIIMSFALA